MLWAVAREYSPARQCRQTASFAALQISGRTSFQLQSPTLFLTGPSGELGSADRRALWVQDRMGGSEVVE